MLSLHAVDTEQPQGERRFHIYRVGPMHLICVELPGRHRLLPHSLALVHAQHVRGNNLQKTIPAQGVFIGRLTLRDQQEREGKERDQAVYPSARENGEYSATIARGTL